MQEETLAADSLQSVAATQDNQRRTGSVHCRQRKRTMDLGHFAGEEEGKKEDEGEEMNEEKKDEEGRE